MAREAHTYGMRENTRVCVCANKIDRPRKIAVIRESEGRKWARDSSRLRLESVFAAVRRERFRGF